LEPCFGLLSIRKHGRPFAMSCIILCLIELLHWKSFAVSIFVTNVDVTLSWITVSLDSKHMNLLSFFRKKVLNSTNVLNWLGVFFVQNSIGFWLSVLVQQANRARIRDSLLRYRGMIMNFILLCANRFREILSATLESNDSVTMAFENLSIRALFFSSLASQVSLHGFNFFVLFDLIRRGWFSVKSV